MKLIVPRALAVSQSAHSILLEATVQGGDPKPGPWGSAQESLLEVSGNGSSLSGVAKQENVSLELQADIYPAQRTRLDRRSSQKKEEQPR